jgi:hypothetical protein
MQFEYPFTRYFSTLPYNISSLLLVVEGGVLDRNIRAFAVCSAILRDWNNAFYSAILIYTKYDTGLCGLEILEDTMVCITQFSTM